MNWAPSALSVESRPDGVRSKLVRVMLRGGKQKEKKKIATILCAQFFTWSKLPHMVNFYSFYNFCNVCNFFFFFLFCLRWYNGTVDLKFPKGGHLQIRRKRDALRSV